jgi:hypothetical protein
MSIIKEPSSLGAAAPAVWFLENGDIYLGNMKNGKCSGSGILVEI